MKSEKTLGRSESKKHARDKNREEGGRDRVAGDQGMPGERCEENRKSLVVTISRSYVGDNYAEGGTQSSLSSLPLSLSLSLLLSPFSLLRDLARARWYYSGKQRKRRARARGFTLPPSAAVAAAAAAFLCACQVENRGEREGKA